MAEEAPKESAGGKNVGMAALCYIWILVLVPLLTDAKNDPFVKFHIKQGLVLLIAWIIAGVANWILALIPVIGWLIMLVIWIGLFVLWIMGLIAAINGQEKTLPIIGKYGEKFNI